jgi:CRISPR-associated protein Csm1
MQPRDIADRHVQTLTYLVSTADHLSSSERGEHSGSYQDYHTTPLASVFQRLYTTDPVDALQNIHPVSLTDPERLDYQHFPDTFRGYAPGELEKLLTEFGSRWRAACDANLSGSFDTLLALLLDTFHCYTWCIVADTQEDFPDVSLFDHLKTTAAIAACLYQYAVRHGQLNEQQVRESKAEERFCLVVGDLSGIQDYIFRITSGGDPEGKGTARRLRARSLFIQMLTDVLAHRILHRFELPLTNVLMLSGGRFYLLLPNLPETVQMLEEEKAEADRWLHHHLNGEVAANLSWVTFGDTGFSQNADTGWGGVLRRDNEGLAVAKARRLERVLIHSQAAGGGWNEEALLLSGFSGANACASCNSRPQAGGRDDQFCYWCRADWEWGRLVPEAQWVAFYDRPDVPGAREVLGYSVLMGTGRSHPAPESYLTLFLNHPPVVDAGAPSSLRFLANHVPSNQEGDTLPFAEIAKESKGRHLLAFVKADVDNLGHAFAFGLKGLASPSRVATMSRQLDLFFTGWVEHTLRQEKFASCYTVFSGGDDLFLVGPWNVMLELVSQLREDFARWVAGKLTFSAGALIGSHHYPISRAAHEAEEELGKAKREGRDRLSLLGHVLTWEDWGHIRRRWRELEGWVEKGKVATAFLYSLLEYGRMWQQYRQGNVLGLRFQPMLAYNIARNLDRRGTPELYNWAEALTGIRPFTAEQRLELNNLELLAQLVILGKEGGRE